MEPIQKLLNRILWDPDFRASSFEIGYLDHVERTIIRVPFGNVRIQSGNRFSFEYEDEAGEIRSIPFHRIREVHRDGILVWKRPPREADMP
jgi:uncharacterized protein (UPF0248 family)